MHQGKPPDFIPSPGPKKTSQMSSFLSRIKITKHNASQYTNNYVSTHVCLKCWLHVVMKIVATWIIRLRMVPSSYLFVSVQPSDHRHSYPTVVGTRDIFLLHSLFYCRD
ncbi:hypothetical protein VPH35_110927 [Triticum aestivum]